MKSKRSRACDITAKVKRAVWERDGHRCIICGSSSAMPNAHYIPRSKGGLGIEQNIVTLCQNCHYMTDQSINRPYYLAFIKAYLEKHYPGFSDRERVYRK